MNMYIEVSIVLVALFIIILLRIYFHFKWRNSNPRLQSDSEILEIQLDAIRDSIRNTFILRHINENHPLSSSTQRRQPPPEYENVKESPPPSYSEYLQSTEHKDYASHQSVSTKTAEPLENNSPTSNLINEVSSSRPNQSSIAMPFSIVHI